MYVKLMNDYTVDLPLWADDGLADGESLDLPPELEANLRAWAAQFNENFEVERGWPSAEMAQQHRIQGERLFAQLSAALPNDEVTFHYWETAHR